VRARCTKRRLRLSRTGSRCWQSLLAVGDGRVSAAKAAGIREQLVRILDDVGGAQGGWGEAADGGAAGQEAVQVNLLVGYFTAESPTA
jgi:hypothetical protein